MTRADRRAAGFPLRLDQLTAPVARPEPARALLRPQAPVQHAHGSKAGAATPGGLGLDSNGVRSRMVERLRGEGIGHPAVLAAMQAVARHLFVDSALAAQAYEDTSLPIGHGQTISKPSVVARMIELLMGSAQARTHGHLGAVLEIGTGCGYQAALLERLARRVVSMERIRPLHEKARENLAAIRAGSLRLVHGDGMLGHAPNAPYDAIIAAAGGAALPPAWLEQLAIGGRLVAPMHDGPAGRQVLVVVDRDEQGYHRSMQEAVKFVPLKSGLVE